MLNRVLRELSAKNQSKVQPLIEQVGLTKLPDAPTNQAELAADEIQGRVFEEIQKNHIRIEEYLDVDFKGPKSVRIKKLIKQMIAEREAHLRQEKEKAE